MTAPELKPCPFCGGKPYLANVEMVGCAYVVCTGCRAAGDDASAETAVSRWNTRAPLDGMVKALVKIRARAMSTRGDQAYREFPRFAEKAARDALRQIGGAE